MHRLALHGSPGAGKSTSAALLVDAFTRAGVQASIVKVAAPLYELQALIYSLAGRPLMRASRQDGNLLGDLAVHLRRINPTALTDLFARQIGGADPHCVLVCDDIRAPDVEALVELGFVLVEVRAPERLRRQRKAERGDLTPGRDDHPAEQPITHLAGHHLVNDTSLANLRACTEALAAAVLTGGDGR